MNEKPYRVINPHGVAWTPRFKTEEAAWGRILSANGGLLDVPHNRAAMLRQGWRLKVVDPAAVELGDKE